ncbi:MAG: hypothetical protein JW821_02620 [Deltaproteobacteria bacterium]|nr:hypothetical protein [Deltaproteobacteria bacterium]
MSSVRFLWILGALIAAAALLCGPAVPAHADKFESHFLIIDNETARPIWFDESPYWRCVGGCDNIGGRAAKIEPGEYRRFEFYQHDLHGGCGWHTGYTEMSLWTTQPSGTGVEWLARVKVKWYIPDANPINPASWVLQVQTGHKASFSDLVELPYAEAHFIKNITLHIE